MRKALLGAVVVATLALGTVAAAGTETFGGLPVVHVVVNGKALDVPGVIVEGKTMAPVRAVAESLGGTIAWDPASYTATITAQDATQLQAENAKLKAEVDELKAQLQPASAPTTALGYSRTKPAPLGTTLTTSVKNVLDDYTAKITMLEAVRGDAAWRMVQAANSFNDAPKTGMEYVAVRLKVELVTSAGDKAVAVSPVHFTAVSATGKEYDTVLVVAPDPRLSTSLYSGATQEGWAVYQVAKDDAAPVLAYGRKYDGTGGIWFALAPNR